MSERRQLEQPGRSEHNITVCVVGAHGRQFGSTWSNHDVPAKSSVPPKKCQYPRGVNIPVCQYPRGKTVSIYVLYDGIHYVLNSLYSNVHKEFI